MNVTYNGICDICHIELVRHVAVTRLYIHADKQPIQHMVVCHNSNSRAMNKDFYLLTGYECHDAIDFSFPGSFFCSSFSRFFCAGVILGFYTIKIFENI